MPPQNSERDIAQTPTKAPTRGKVVLHYRLAERFYEAVLGPDHRHVGLYGETDSLDIEQGGERMLQLMLTKLGLFDRSQGTKTHLDAGCGVGALALAVGKLGHDVLGINISHLQLQKAADKLKAEKVGGTLRGNVSFELRDAQNTGLPDESFDTITCVEAIFHMDRERFLREAFRLLKPGGKLVLTDTELLGEPTKLKQTILKEAFVIGEFYPQDQYPQMMKAIGFEKVEVVSLRAETERTVAAIRKAIEDDPKKITDAYGPVMGWLVLELLKRAWGLMEGIYGKDMGYYYVYAQKPTK